MVPPPPRAGGELATCRQEAQIAAYHESAETNRRGGAPSAPLSVAARGAAMESAAPARAGQAGVSSSASDRALCAGLLLRQGAARGRGRWAQPRSRRKAATGRKAR